MLDAQIALIRIGKGLGFRAALDVLVGEIRARVRHLTHFNFRIMVREGD